MHEEIKIHLKSPNEPYFARVSMYKSRLLSRNTKVNLYTTY